MKCPKCLTGELYLTDSGGEPEYQEPQWVRCDNDEVSSVDEYGEMTYIECDFTDDNDTEKYEELQSWYGFDADEFLASMNGEESIGNSSFIMD